MRNTFFLAITMVVMAACGTKKAAEEAKDLNTNIITLTDAQYKNAALVVGKIGQQSMSTILRVNGKIDVPPQNMVSISVPLGGYLKTTKLLPGQHVSKGEVIAVMEDQQYIQLQQDYLTAKAKISYLENEYQRQKELNASKASSDKVYQLAESDYKIQKVLITALAEKLQLAGINVLKINETTISRSVNIYSPINGYVSKVNVNIGKYVSPTDVLFELINPTDIHLALKVYEKDVDKLFIGQNLIAYTNNQPERKHECEVLLIGKDLSSERNTDVHCHFEDYDKSLIPGTYMNAEIKVTNAKVYALPEDAIVRFGNKQYVFTQVAEKQFQMLEIQTGEANNGVIEVKNGDALATKNIVQKGAYTLLMSLKNKSEE
ncbi:MAG: efflux RND transporter periplasmic adaptor subunit [Flavobacterium sp.]|nr:efflux RND transporter periplasmic adaptor subunit [Flavobacterium sp.]